MNSVNVTKKIFLIIEFRQVFKVYLLRSTFDMLNLPDVLQDPQKWNGKSSKKPNFGL